MMIKNKKLMEVTITEKMKMRKIKINVIRQKISFGDKIISCVTYEKIQDPPENTYQMKSPTNQTKKEARHSH